MRARAGTKPNAENVANLRLPVPFFDLLMVLLVTCLVFVAPVRPDEDTRSLDMSVAHGKAGTSAGPLLAVLPRRVGAGWTFTVAGKSQALSIEALARRAEAAHSKVALVVPPATPIQDFVTMQTDLAAHNIPFALAIKTAASDNTETGP